ncbi:MAG: putative IIA-like nitrogen-regulatory protein PtsN [Lacrimispora sp.]|jgi:PTS system fructose-specific IIA component|nr:putative IIA-like nitrogen-regulatory protein PtsN [Lacrimispora sp.]
MAVKAILDKEVIDLDMVAEDKESAIRYLSGLLYEAGYVADIEGFIKDVFIRESEGITGIGNHVAIPHGKSDYVKKVGIAIGKTKNMIAWESYDEQPVHYVFLFAVPSDNENAMVHLKLLSELAGKLGNEQTMEKLETCKNFSDLTDTFEG